MIPTLNKGEVGVKVRNFQMLLGVKPDGICGEQTWAAYSAADKTQLEEVNEYYKGVPYDRKTFFDNIRPLFFKGFSAKQVQAIDYLLDILDVRSLPITWQAYMFATIFLETAATMLPIAEYGKGKGRPYGRKLKSDRTTYQMPDALYYGRGYVQLTWYDNYEYVGKQLDMGDDLLKNPELALEPYVAYRIMEFGMTTGFFTGKKLSDYCDDWSADYTRSRRIINGNDKATEIAKYAEQFEYAIRCSKMVRAGAV